MSTLFQPGYLPAQTLSGNVFIGSTTYAGIIPPLYSATGQLFGLWNPAGSGKNAMLIKLNLGVVTVNTPVVGSLGLSYLPNAGSALGTPISAFTATAPVNGLVGRTGGNSAQFTLSATITTPTFFYTLGLSQESATPGTGLYWLEHDFEGAVIVPPNTYIGLGSSAALGQTCQATLVWTELSI